MTLSPGGAYGVTEYWSNGVLEYWSIGGLGKTLSGLQPIGDQGRVWNAFAPKRAQGSEAQDSHLFSAI
jgi:hypothetical protein